MSGFEPKDADYAARVRESFARQQAMRTQRPTRLAPAPVQGSPV